MSYDVARHREDISFGAMRGTCRAPVSPEAGERYGKLVLLSYSLDETTGQKRWLCACDCGRQASPTSGQLNQRLRNGSVPCCRACGEAYRHSVNARRGEVGRERRTQRLSKLFSVARTLYSDWDVEEMAEDTLSALRRAFGWEAEPCPAPVIAVGWKEDPIDLRTDEQRAEAATRQRELRGAKRKAEAREVESQMIADFNRAKRQEAARDAWLERQVQR